MTGADVAARVQGIRKQLATAMVSHCRAGLLELEQELEAIGDTSLATKPRNRHKTVQAVGTPWDYIDALEAEFGPLGWDLASTPELAKAARFITPEMDAFTLPWHLLGRLTDFVRHDLSTGFRAPFVESLDVDTRVWAAVREAEERAKVWTRADRLDTPFADRFNYLNPEFKQSDLWTRKCAEEAALGARIIVLLQASIDTEYYQDHILGKCECRLMKGRLKFTGHTHQFPKALMTLVYEPGRPARVVSWDWKKGVLRPC